MAEKAPFRGLVVSVAIAGYERLMATQNPAAIGQMLDSAAEALSVLARREDFFCHAGGGEFVLVFARENGAAAQRRVAQIAERLWDFQLRSLGSLTIHFNWGVAECDGETFAEGLDSAREQMRESEVRRGGKAPADRPQRAVNG
jgi:GGDEF domain-containing protein